MYCTNCGKNIGEVNFCPHCGKCRDDTQKVFVKESNDGIIPLIIRKIKQKNYSAWIKIYSVIFAVLSIVVRLCNNVIEVEYYILAQDDFYVASDGARACLIIFMLIQVLVSVYLIVDGKMKNIKISIGAIILLAISLLIELTMLLLKFPAPY